MRIRIDTRAPENRKAHASQEVVSILLSLDDLRKYDCAQNVIVAIENCRQAIIASLFPARIKDRP